MIFKSIIKLGEGGAIHTAYIKAESASSAKELHLIALDWDVIEIEELPPEYSDRVDVNQFYQLKSQGNDTVGGRMEALCIPKVLMEKHGGEIENLVYIQYRANGNAAPPKKDVRNEYILRRGDFINWVNTYPVSFRPVIDGIICEYMANNCPHITCCKPE